MYMCVCVSVVCVYMCVCMSVRVCAFGRVHAIICTGNVPRLICGGDLEKRVIIMTHINMCHEHPFV